METQTSIGDLLSLNFITVPSYQRAYSWDAARQVDTFYNDIQDYIGSCSTNTERRVPYYFGHFLFQYISDKNYAVIDGQQRLTTITIFLAALFRRLESLRVLTDEEIYEYKSMLRLGSRYRFSTVYYDNQFFRDCVINGLVYPSFLDTVSKRRILDALDYFNKALASKSSDEICKLKDIVKNSVCTTHVVENEQDSIQMFIFQNNRGKKPSNLEIIKAQFMYTILIYGSDERESLLEEIRNRFETIYTSISKIEKRIGEDNVLEYTLRYHFNSLWESSALQKVQDELKKDSRIDFIREFSHNLYLVFNNLVNFFEQEKVDLTLQSLIKVGDWGILMPFIVAMYEAHLSAPDMQKLVKALESIFIRHSVIRTRADLRSRLNDVYKNFNKGENKGRIEPIIERIEWMKDLPEGGSWGYWCRSVFERMLSGGMPRDVAKFLLWKYENHLRAVEGNAGYKPCRYDEIGTELHLEHIAPQTENTGENSGYCEYDEEFRNEYLECLGNYLLLSGSHNESVSNGPFSRKRDTYRDLRQQREIADMTMTDLLWDKAKIAARKNKIVDYILKNF